jgi:iron complex transport system ATP-binding protein
MTSKKLWSRMAYVPQAKAAASAYTAFETVLLGRSSRLNAFSTPKQEDLKKAVYDNLQPKK